MVKPYRAMIAAAPALKPAGGLSFQGPVEITGDAVARSSRFQGEVHHPARWIPAGLCDECLKKITAAEGGNG